MLEILFVHRPVVCPPQGDINSAGNETAGFIKPEYKDLLFLFFLSFFFFTCYSLLQEKTAYLVSSELALTFRPKPWVSR